MDTDRYLRRLLRAFLSGARIGKLFDEDGAFGIENHGYSPLISQKYVVKGDFEVYDGMDLLHHAMLNTLPNINKDGGKDEHGKTIRIPDFEARQKADTLITEIRQAFVEWLHAQPTISRSG